MQVNHVDEDIIFDATYDDDLGNSSEMIDAQDAVDLNFTNNDHLNFLISKYKLKNGKNVKHMMEWKELFATTNTTLLSLQFHEVWLLMV